MKKYTAVLLCLLLFLSGCSQTPEDASAVNFYYLSAEISYSGDSSTIESEIRSDTQMEPTEQILRTYLAGPTSAHLRSPFPAGLRLVEYRQESETVYLCLSQELATLSNLDLTLACSCITLTCLDLTDAQQVCIEAEDSLLAGNKSIIMDRQSLLLTDINAKGE